MKKVLQHLQTITPPRLVREGLATLGTLEKKGSGSNKTIVNWAKETKNPDDNWYNDDSVPWCGLWMCVIAERSEWQSVKEPLRAKSWANFGQRVKEAALGDVLVFSRDGGGHVGIYVGESTSNYFVLGGNQGDSVSITEIAKNRIFSINRPTYNVVPESVQKIIFTSTGVVSKNEA